MFIVETLIETDQRQLPGYSTHKSGALDISYILTQAMLKFMENFSMTFAENRTYGVPEFAGTEVNRHSGKLKGLSGYLQNHHDTMVGDKTQQTQGPLLSYG